MLVGLESATHAEHDQSHSCSVDVDVDVDVEVDVLDGVVFAVVGLGDVVVLGLPVASVDGEGVCTVPVTAGSGGETFAGGLEGLVVGL